MLARWGFMGPITALAGSSPVRDLRLDICLKNKNQRVEDAPIAEHGILKSEFLIIIKPFFFPFTSVMLFVYFALWPDSVLISTSYFPADSIFPTISVNAKMHQTVFFLFIFFIPHPSFLI